jgi:hypothetical protein
MDNPLYEIMYFCRQLHISKLLRFIELLNKSYHSRGLLSKEWHISNKCALTAIKVEYYCAVQKNANNSARCAEAVYGVNMIKALQEGL